MKTGDFDYVLPAELIAQTPLSVRDRSQLMVLDRSDASVQHGCFGELTDYLRDGDVLVFNDSRVIPARLSGTSGNGAGRLEILLLRRLRHNVWETLVRPGRRVPVGTRIEITGGVGGSNGQDCRVTAETVAVGEGGIRVMSFSDEASLAGLGEIPLPPYIHLPLADPERYQTVYARPAGSAAAPTAGLHFTPQLMDKIKDKGINCLFATLHIGLDTFRPVREENPLEHPIHREYGVLTPEVAAELSRAKQAGRRIIAVGTTTVRLLEAAAVAGESLDIKLFEGWVDLFILPGHRFRLVDAMITNFHLPRSTLLMLVSAFAGREFIMRAYQEAIDRQYRFYSFGDCMLIL